MTTQVDPGQAGTRLYGMMRLLLALAASGHTAPSPAARGVVTADDAVDAVLQVAVVIDQAVKSGAITSEQGFQAGSMLMLVRDYVRPLPPGSGEGPADMVTGDLLALARVLRRGGAEGGLQG